METPGLLGDEPDGDGDLPPATVLFDALADDGRRWVLAEVAAADDPVGLDALAARAGGTTRWDDPDRTAVRLHHAALPRLDDAGLVAYDVDAGTVETTAAGAAVDSQFPP